MVSSPTAVFNLTIDKEQALREASPGPSSPAAPLMIAEHGPDSGTAGR